jgi:thioredoxin 1
MSEITLDNSNFKDTISSGLTLVDFWAPWCGPCRMLGPVIEEISNEVEGAQVAKLNVDENQQIAAEYGVMSIPTVILFKDGEIAETMVGLRPKEDYLATIENNK